MTGPNELDHAATLDHNREAWDRRVAEGNMWTLPVSTEVIEAARRGEWSVVLIGMTPVTRSWFPDDLNDLDLLGLASGGGQQCPVLAAAGARVTVFDNSPAQLEQDRAVSERHGLGIRTVQGDMADLAAFENESFDLVFHPVSNVFAPDVRPVWREAYRVLRPGGRLLSGFMNPDLYIFDYDRYEKTGERVVRYALPYADTREKTREELDALREQGIAFEFGHTLTDQIGGQLDAGFQLLALEESERTESTSPGLLDGYAPSYIATWAHKPG